MLEYTRRDGSSTLYRNHHDSISYLRLYHRAGFLNRIPSNVCDFSSKLVKIELINNEMFEIGNISCLLSLDTLDLSHNKITFIGNETFINLTNLRVLKVAYNGLKTLERPPSLGIHYRYSMLTSPTMSWKQSSLAI